MLIISIYLNFNLVGKLEGVEPRLDYKHAVVGSTPNSHGQKALIIIILYKIHD